MSRGRPKDRSNGYPADGHAPDGFRVDGWRRVTKRGSVRFHDHWTHPDLFELAGSYVFVQLEDGWAQEASFQTEAEHYGSGTRCNFRALQLAAALQRPNTSGENA